MHSVYIAAPFHQRDKVQNIARTLRGYGYHILDRWTKNHIFSTGNQDFRAPENMKEADRFAREDIEDVMRANILILLDEPGTETHGRQVELGIAIMCVNHIWLVGPPENIFWTLQNKIMGTEIKKFENVAELLEWANPHIEVEVS